MAGYTRNRETNIEIKYLRKSLGQVDKRIQLPKSLDAESLLGLLDDIEHVSPREVASRRPRWLSLQSGIAYAAAFVLIVGLFYASRLYRPEIIDGGLTITNNSQAKSQASSPNDASVSVIAEDTKANLLVASSETSPQQATPEAIAADATVAPPQESSAASSIVDNTIFGVGGSGKSTSMLKQDNFEYLWRTNDVNDPDRKTPVTVEVINTATNVLAAQIDVPSILDVRYSLIADEKLIIIGTSDSRSNELNVMAYSSIIPATGDEPQIFTVLGSFMDAKFHENVLYLTSLSDHEVGNQTVKLPSAKSHDEYCTITAIDFATGTANSVSYAGTNLNVVFVEDGAEIHYNDETSVNTAVVSFDGVKIG